MKSSNLQKILSNTNQYPPSEDTFFLADNIENEKGFSALDIGTGSGFLADLLSKNFSIVIGTDLSFSVLANQSYKIQNAICCNGADALDYKFDLIVCNMPYLATDEIIDITTDGGIDGLEIPTKIIQSAKLCLSDHGKFLFITSTLSNYKKLIEFVKLQGMSADIISRKKLFFEELLLICAQN